MTLRTTLRLLRDHGACSARYAHLVTALGTDWTDDAAVPLERILDTNGIDDALWALRATPPEQDAERDRLARLFACDCAESVLPIWLARHPDDDRPAAAIRAAREYARDPSSARAAKRGAASSDAWDAANEVKRSAEWSAARAAAWAAAWSAARAAAMAAMATARTAARAAQSYLLRSYLRGER